jgi:hypothetical protein
MFWEKIEGKLGSDVINDAINISGMKRGETITIPIPNPTLWNNSSSCPANGGIEQSPNQVLTHHNTVSYSPY